jgi:hypothetical protein
MVLLLPIALPSILQSDSATILLIASRSPTCLVAVPAGRLIGPPEDSFKPA